MYKIRNKLYHPVSVWESIQSIIPSGYIRKGTLQVFHKIRKNYPNDHILCIGYKRGDTQFGITETFKTYETRVEQVVDRCLKEECSMELAAPSLDCLSFVYKEKYATIHCVPLRVTHDNLRPCVISQSLYAGIDDDDDKTRKLVLLMHGSPEVIRPVFSRFASVEEDISHLASVPIRDAHYIFPKLFPMMLYPVKPTSFLTPCVKEMDIFERKQQWAT